MKIFFLILSLSLSLLAGDRVVKLSQCSVDETVQNIERIVTKKGLSAFAIIDHKQNAQSVIAKEHTININKVSNINKGMDNITTKAGQ